MFTKENVKLLKDNDIDLIISHITPYDEEYRLQVYDYTTKETTHGKMTGGIVTDAKFCRTGNTDGLCVYKDTGCRQHRYPGFEVMFWNVRCECCGDGDWDHERFNLDEEDELIVRVILEFSK